MKEAIIIDPVPNNRSTMTHQLSSIEPYSIIQFSTIAEAKRNIFGASPYKGLIFVSVADGIPIIVDFMTNLRQTNQHASVITLSSALTMNDMRSLIEAGVDQILIRPFSSSQLMEKITASENFRKQIQQENLNKPDASFFEARVEIFTDKFFRVALAGWLGENCALPELKGAQQGSTTFIDCDLLKGLNSIGIRLWVLWIKLLAANGFTRFEFENLHPSFLNQSRAIKGMLPEQSSVNSFYLRYWNDELEEEREYKLSRGKDYASEKMIIPKFQKEVIKGKTYLFELDELTPQIAHFFNGKIEITEK